MRGIAWNIQSDYQLSLICTTGQCTHRANNHGVKQHEETRHGNSSDDDSKLHARNVFRVGSDFSFSSRKTISPASLPEIGCDGGLIVRSVVALVVSVISLAGRRPEGCPEVGPEFMVDDADLQRQTQKSTYGLLNK